MIHHAHTTPTPPRYAGLDGLRAVAVALVVIYHLFPGVGLPGGFIGVDVFFVISGFLITALLLREHDATGGIRLGAFWRRRARRLLPALGVVVTVCATAAWAVGGDVLVRLGEQVLGAATFSYNWLSIAAGDGYFAASGPELFRNVWSLAVEEQFYLVWPLLLLLLVRIPPRWARIAVVLVAAGSSAAWMGVVAATDGVTRAYFGTDTHAFGLLLGVALALVLAPRLARREPVPVGTLQLSGGWRVVDPRIATGRSRVPVVTTLIGGAALAGLVGLAVVPETDGPWTFPGALLLASLLTAVAITAAVWPGSPFGRMLDAPVLRWVGDRSYGIYLWHWPLLVLVTAAVQGVGPEVGVPPLVGVGVLVVTLAAAELSHRLVEAPVRRQGFRGALRVLGGRLRGTPATRLGAIAMLGVGALVIGGTSAAIALAPQETSAETAVAVGAEALEEAAAPRPTPTPEPTVAPVVVTGDSITAIGDSVMLASAPALFERLPGIQVDAVVSRQAWAGPRIVADLASAGALRDVVVVSLGTNGTVDEASLDGILDAAGPDRLIVFVTAYAPRDWIDGVNAEIASFDRRHHNVVVADWASAIAPHQDLLAGDRIHPGADGGRVFADVVANTVQGALQNAAESAERMRLRDLDRDLPRPQ